MKLKKFPELTLNDITQAVSQYEAASAQGQKPVFFDDAEAVNITFHALSSWGNLKHDDTYDGLRARVLAVMFIELPRLLKVIHNIGEIAQFLMQAERKLFEEQLTTDVCHNLFTQLSDLHAVNHATSSAGPHVLKQVTSKMVDLVTNQQQFLEALTQLHDDAITHFCDALAAKGKLWTVVGNNFAAVIAEHNKQVPNHVLNDDIPHYLRLQVLPSQQTLVETCLQAYLEQGPVSGCSNGSASQSAPTVNMPLQSLPPIRDNTPIV